MANSLVILTQIEKTNNNAHKAIFGNAEKNSLKLIFLFWIANRQTNVWCLNEVNITYFGIENKVCPTDQKNVNDRHRLGSKDPINHEESGYSYSSHEVIS